MAEQNNQILLETKDLQKHFPIKDFFGRKKQAVKAVDGITFQIRKGETFGLVGESGCGKSTLGRTLIRMYEPTGGQIIFDGEDITKLEGAKLQPYHKRMQIIFQDPYSALDPHHNVEEIIREPMSLYTNASKSDIDEQIVELLKKVGMKADDMYKYAYEFSGGQRQRIGIARALAVKPEFLLCDEPISALDVSIQAQVVNMLEDLQTSKQELSEFASSLINNPDTDVTIEGYTDNVGSLEANTKVANGRADAVKTYLMNSGVASSRLTAKGLPMQDYVASNDTDAGRAQNRRVEIYITANEQMVKQAEAQAQQNS